MTTKRSFLGTTKLATAAVLATGVAASPVALGSGGEIMPNAAQAASPGGDSGAAQEFVDGHETSVTAERDVMLLLGTTHEQVRSQVDSTTNARTGVLDEYQHAMASGNLDRAAEVLAITSNKPITEGLVLKVNDALGIDSTLSAQQVAAEASARQSSRVKLGEDGMARASADPMTSTFTHTAAFRTYEDAMERGSLEAAADALAGATERPITESYVLEVNRDLGIESTLTARQVAEVAADKQRMN